MATLIGLAKPILHWTTSSVVLACAVAGGTGVVTVGLGTWGTVGAGSVSIALVTGAGCATLG